MPISTERGEEREKIEKGEGRGREWWGGKGSLICL